jgi:hypothetical protein
MLLDERLQAIASVKVDTGGGVFTIYLCASRDNLITSYQSIS